MTQQSCKYTPEDVKSLREHTGAGFIECRNALDKFDGDWLLAAGYLKYQGCAVAIWRYDEHGNRVSDMENWLLKRAQQYKDQQLAVLTKPSDTK